MYSYFHPMPSPNPRKRPAPGSVPLPQMAQPFSTQDQLLRWNGNNAAGYVENTSNGANSYGVVPSPTQAQYAQSTPSTVIARRGMNNALIASNRAYSPQQTDPWPSFDDTLVPGTTDGPIDEHDNIELLEDKAQKAKRDALAKRKQIPPFVQKLNSFLEESKNTDLIRWSEKGDSFIVLDEDEFAKTLIPELFKHNNYASFVRQLNMYGFHKKVGLSDNSMKASERKNKSPSEYYNPYFKRGHPNLLWLINKPKSGNNKKVGKKRGEDGEGESDEDVVVPDDVVNHPFAPQTAQNRALPAPETGSLQKKDLALVRDQMMTMQARQKQISDAIQRLRQEHNQLYQQALMFQTQHDRHENSINAILNFLANVFRKSLEEQGGVQNVNDLLASIIPNVQMPPQGQGSVVDLGDWVQQQVPRNTTPVGTPKRSHRLLPPIPQNQSQAARTPMATTTATTPFPNYPSHQQSGQVTEVLDTPSDSAGTPAYFKQELESNPQEGMMKIIQDTNTNAGNVSVDLPNVAANTSATLTNDQRNRMLSIMSGSQRSAAHTPVPSATSPSVPAEMNPSVVGIPSVGSLPAPQARNSLSPIMSSVPPPSIERLSQTNDELERLQRLQHEQSQKLDDLGHLLGPLSPSGHIPGLDSSNTYFDDNYDLNQYIDTNAYNADDTGGAFNFDGAPEFNDNTNFEWTEPGGGDFGTSDGLNVGSRVIETNTPSHNTPSPSGTEEILRNDLDDSPGRATKRQRKA